MKGTQGTTFTKYNSKTKLKLCAFVNLKFSLQALLNIDEHKSKKKTRDIKGEEVV